MNPIHPDFVLATLARVDGDAFERFFKEFGAAVYGVEFTPVGGKHDGGADAFEQSGLFGGRKGTYYQASVQETYRRKLRETVLRLREYGREVHTLVYVTSRLISDMDAVIMELSKELDVTIVVMDAQGIANRINANEHTRAAFQNHLSSFAPFVGANNDMKPTPPQGVNLNAAVYLAQEALSPGARKDLRGTVIDSLILYVLEEEALAADQFLAGPDITRRAKQLFPTGYDFGDQEVIARISLLSSKEHPAGRQMTWDSRFGGYKLTYEERCAIAERHAKFDALTFKVREQARDIILQCVTDEVSEQDVAQMVDIHIGCLEHLYRREGMKVAQFFAGSEEQISETTVSDIVLGVMKERAAPPARMELFHTALMEVVRRTFYESTAEQREYISYLSRTYSLLFSLRYDLKIAKYFADVKSNFRLVVGADVVIGALTESGLREKDRSVQGLLKLARAAGATLILTDYAVEEIYTHILSAHWEYVNNYQERDQYITLAVASNIRRTLIRSYFYAKLRPADERLRVRSWGAFLEQFLPFAEIETAEAKLALRSYLRDKFGLTLELKEDVEDLIDSAARDRLASKLMYLGLKDNRALAKNDASHVLAVYAMRDQGSETSKGSPSGYRTWWLTQETRIQQGFDDLTVQKGKAIMRPEVLLQILSFAPKSEEIEHAFGEFFPSIVGVRLGNRVNPEVLKGMIRDAERIAKADPARIRAEMERVANRLKADETARLKRLFTGPIDLLA